jgi:hypothetical protein
MLAPFLIVMLVVFLTAFLGLEQFANNVMQASDIRILGFSILSEEFRVFLGAGTIFFEAAIIFFVMLDRVGDVIRTALIPVARLVPLVLFVFTAWNTLAPVIVPLLPAGVGELVGVYGNQVTVAQTVSSGSFAVGVMLTLGTMLFFALTTYTLGRQENAEVRALRQELARYQKALKGVRDVA